MFSAQARTGIPLKTDVNRTIGTLKEKQPSGAGSGGGSERGRGGEGSGKPKNTD